MKKTFFKLKNHYSVSQFTAVSAIDQEIKEIVFLEGDDLSGPIDISKIYSLFCLQPLLIGVVMINPEKIDKKNKFVLSVVSVKLSDGNDHTNKTNPSAKINLQYFDFIQIHKNVGILLLQVKKSRLFQLNWIDRYRITLLLYLHYLKVKKRNSISFINNLGAIYSYPRKVILNIIKTDSHFNIFPMDLVCELDEERIVLLGLNIKNRSIEEILRTKKMLIVNPDAASKNIIYSFAGNHKKELLESDFTGMHTFKSEGFNFPIPNFTSSYKEISCFNYIKLGSHYLLICKVINKKILKTDIPLLYHISAIHQLHLEKQNNPYTVV
jgi:flavin reductase (DIM6/NTAB) family NADH-FMN oxidoreductase RutF